MNGVLLLILLIYAVLLLVRAIRWVAIVQQKEYRLDRLWVFVRSAEGLAECVKIVPGANDLTWTGFKRPKLTTRALLSLFLLGSEILVVCAVGYNWLIVSDVVGSLPSIAVWLIMILIAVPVLAVATAVPTSIIARYKTSQVSAAAAQLVAQHAPLIIGITGSYGKSSTKQLLAHVLRKKFSVFATPRSFNTRYSVARSVVEGYAGEEVLILEYGAYGTGEISRLAADLPPGMAILTGFAPQHLGLFGSEDAIARAKAELVQALPTGAQVFTNGDDKGVQRIVRAAARLEEVVETEFRVDSVPWLKRAKLSPEGQLTLPAAGEGIVTQLIGRHYLQTIAAVWSVAHHLGMSQSAVQAQVQTFEPTKNFIRARTTASNVRIIDDGGTSNPQGFLAAIALMAELEFPKKILLTPGIVDLGEQTELIHRHLAQAAWDAGVSEVLFVGSNGREEFLALFGSARVTSERSAVSAALGSLSPGSLLVIEGRMPGWCADILKQL